MIPSEFAAADAVVVLRDWVGELENASLEKPLRSTLPIWHQGIEDNFMRAAGPSGAPWLPRKDNKPHPLLILTGKLLEGLRDTGNPGHILMVGWRSLTTGVSSEVVPYAPVHEFGSGRVPARPYMYATPAVQDVALRVFADEVFEILVGV